MLQCPLLGIILIRGYLEDYLCLIEVVFPDSRRRPNQSPIWRPRNIDLIL